MVAPLCEPHPHTQQLIVCVAFCTPHHCGVQAPPAVFLPHDSKVDAMPLFGLGVLPRLLVYVPLCKPCVTNSGFIGQQEGQKLFASIISSPYPWGPRTFPHKSSALILDPTRALKSPSMMYVSFDGMADRACWRSSKNLSSLSARLAAQVGA